MDVHFFFPRCDTAVFATFDFWMILVSQIFSSSVSFEYMIPFDLQKMKTLFSSSLPLKCCNSSRVLVTVAEQKEKLYADQMKILHREKAELDRKKRNHRLFTRGAMLESFMRKPLLLTDDQVYRLLKTAFNVPAVQAEEAVLIYEATGDPFLETSREKPDSE